MRLRLAARPCSEASSGTTREHVRIVGAHIIHQHHGPGTRRRQFHLISIQVALGDRDGRPRLALRATCTCRKLCARPLASVIRYGGPRAPGAPRPSPAAARERHAGGPPRLSARRMEVVVQRLFSPQRTERVERSIGDGGKYRQNGNADHHLDQRKPPTTRHGGTIPARGDGSLSQRRAVPVPPVCNVVTTGVEGALVSWTLSATQACPSLHRQCQSRPRVTDGPAVRNRRLPIRKFPLGEQLTDPLRTLTRDGRTPAASVT